MNLNILSLNMHKGLNWFGKPTLNSLCSQIENMKPDFIFLQEVCGHQLEVLSKNFPHFVYGKNVNYKNQHYGNAILSLYPLKLISNVDISVGKFEKRGLLHSSINAPQFEKPLHLICLHLGLLKNYRQKQLEKIISYINKHIPAQESLIISGDFNDWRCCHTSEVMLNKLGLKESFLDEHGSYAKTFPAWLPILKLDRIYSRGFDICEAERMMQQHWKILSDHIALNVNLKLVSRLSLSVSK